MITGEEQPDEGQVTGLTIGHFSQDVGEMSGRGMMRCAFHFLGRRMHWTKFVINFVLGWVPDALIALAYAKFVELGWSEFWVAMLALQALYFALWFKHAVWAWLLFWLYNRFPLARTFEKFFADNKLPRPEMWVGDLDDYFDQILGDDTIDAETKIKVAYEKGSLNGSRLRSRFHCC